MNAITVSQDQRSFGKVAVMLGGRSAEREVSLKSGHAVLAALRARDIEAHAFDPAEHPLERLVSEKFDRVFIALHGRFGEDGTLQGALEWLGLPYTGSGVLASALAMDKWRTKAVWRSSGIPTPEAVVVSDASELHMCSLTYPVIVKPAKEGSSIGLCKVLQPADLPAAVTLARQYDDTVLVERFIQGQELTVGILGNETLPIVRVEPEGELYDYQAKYISDNTRYHCPSGLPEVDEVRIQALALAAYQALGCRGWGRVDGIRDVSGAIWFLEANTAPGMTDHSLVPMAARAAGMSFEDLVVSILASATVGL